jgi:hypothetical protein
MGTEPPVEQVPSRVRTETVIVSEAAAMAAPVLGIFQPSFPLTHMDFVTIQRPSLFWTGLGSVLCTFSVAYALPKVIGRIQSATYKIEASDWWIIGGTFGLGVVCFGVSRIFSSDRRAVLKRIKQFFKNNPGQPEYRPVRR